MSAPRLDEAWLARQVWPRFSRVLARNELYLANHSLGRPPDRAADDLRAAVDAWYSEMDGAWALWVEGRGGGPALACRRAQPPGPPPRPPTTCARRSTPGTARWTARGRCGSRAASASGPWFLSS